MAHRSASGGQGGEAHDCPIGSEMVEENKPDELMLAAKAYDSADLRQKLKDQETKAINPNRNNRKKKFRFSRAEYKKRHKIANAFCRLKDLRRVATRLDELTFVFAASVHLSTNIAWWT